MQIEVNEVEYCKVHVQVVADLEEIKTKRTEVLNAFKKAPVPGFRQGKASLEVIRIHYRSQIEDAVKRALAEEAFHNTMFEKNIKPFGVPDFKNIELTGTKFSCTFDLQKRPDFEVAPYKGLEIPKPALTQTVDQVYEEMMQNLRVENSEATPFGEDDFAQLGDNLIINYDVFEAETELTHLKGEADMMTLGKSMLEGFDENLLGMKAGETRSFALNVPENALPSLAGKDVTFKVTLVMGSKMNPLPLNDDLALKVGKKDFAELREYVMGIASTKLQAIEKGEVMQQIQARLVADNTFEVPSWLALSEAQYLASGAKVQWDTLAEEDKQKYLTLAEKNVKVALVLDKIREAEPEAQLSDQEVLELIKGQAGKSGLNVDELMGELTRTGYLSVLAARMRDEHTLDFIVKHSTIIE